MRSLDSASRDHEQAERQRGRAGLLRPQRVASGGVAPSSRELAERLLSFAPGKLRKVFRATGGTEAVERDPVIDDN